MGLPMNNIHAPTVASGPTSNGSSNSSDSQRSLMQLMDDRDRVQSELSALGSVLQSHNVNMNTGLTTFDGFPRSDIDVAQIRTTRARIIRLRNDYKSLMARIETGLHDYHANAQAQTAAAPSSPAASSSTPARAGAERATTGTGHTNGVAASSVEAPFAKVNSVVAGSPAETAGLQAGDKITRFGLVNWMNHEKLGKVAQVVQQNEGRPIAVKVLRPAAIGGGSETLEVQLIPRHNWGGRGMLGCHLLPL